MAYVNVPKDLTKVKTKVLFNLTKRQLICFGSGALIGVPLFFLLKGSIGTSPAAMVMMVVMIPAMLFAMYHPSFLFSLSPIISNELLQQFHRALLAWVIRTQFTTKGTGENGFFHQVDLVKNRFSYILGLLFLFKGRIK